MVFDAAAKSAGQSLNSRFSNKPDLVNSLVGVLLRFHKHKMYYLEVPQKGSLGSKGILY